MKSLKFLLLFAFMAVSVSFTNAQGISNINDANFFKAKYTKAKVWSVQRTPTIPIAGKDFKISSLKAAIDANNATIDFGTGRYVMFVSELDNTNTANSLVDDINNKGAKYNVSLKLYESNGTLVKVLSTWGKLIGQGDKGFIYEAQGKSGVFFSVSDLSAKSTVTYKPSLVTVTKLTEIISSVEVASIVKANTKIVTELEKLPDGVIKFYNIQKGYGFIQTTKTGRDAYFHRNGLIDEDVKDGDYVTFVIIDGEKGPQAVNIKLFSK